MKQQYEGDYSGSEIRTWYKEASERFSKDQEVFQNRYMIEGEVVDPKNPDVAAFAGNLAGQRLVLTSFAQMIDGATLPPSNDQA